MAKAAPAVTERIVLFEYERETKNTDVYSEITTGPIETWKDDHVIGKLYVKKKYAEEMGSPKKITVTISITS